MALYLGNGTKLKVRFGSAEIAYKVYFGMPIITGIKLISSDNYELVDKNGDFITVKEAN